MVSADEPWMRERERERERAVVAVAMYDVLYLTLSTLFGQ